MMGRFAIRLTLATTWLSSAGSLEKKMPPCFVFGQETFNS